MRETLFFGPATGPRNISWFARVSMGELWEVVGSRGEWSLLSPVNFNEDQPTATQGLPQRVKHEWFASDYLAVALDLASVLG